MADFKVGDVVGGRNFKNARAEFHIDIFVADNRNRGFGEGAPNVFADVFLIAFVVGVDRDGGVAHNCFGAGGGDFKKSPRLFDDFVFHLEELAFLGGHNDLLVRERGEVYGAPVYHALAAVDVALFEKFDKRRQDAARIVVVEGMHESRPVARGS